MKKLLLILVAALSYYLSGACNTPHKQLLVFRNSGEVNLFFMDSIRSITIEENNSLGTCQVFTTHGENRHFIPVAEIDSVAFGSRNKMELKSGVRILKDDVDIPYINSFDGTALFYNTSTPSTILPSSGDLLYYGQITELLPVGICARVVSSSTEGNKIRIGIETVDPTEIFSQFFFAGDSSDPDVQKLSKAISRAKDYKGSLARFNVNIGGLKSRLDIDYEFNDVVFNIFKQYYHVKCTLKPVAELEFNLKFDDTEEFYETYADRTVHLSPIGGIFIPSFDAALFLKIDASLDFKYKMSRNFSLDYEWTRKGNVDTYSSPSITDAIKNNTNEAQAQLMLDGAIFTGGEISARFGLIGDLGGLGLKINVGPRFKAEIGVGVLRQLNKEYSPELYAKGNIALSLGIDAQTFVYYKTFDTIWGGFKTTEIGPVIKNDFKLFDIHLFPSFKGTQGVAVNRKAVVARTEVEAPIAYPLNVGFNLEPDIEEEPVAEPLATGFLDEMLEADNDEPVGFAYGFDLKALSSEVPQLPEKTVVRPVFKYGNYTIKAESSGVSNNSIYSYYSHISNQNATATAGAWDVRSKTANGTGYLIGNYFPRIKSNPLFSYMGGKGIVMPSEQLQTSIVGKWEGKMGEEQVTLTFNADKTGALSESAFNYSLNNSQAGDIKITFADSNVPSMTLTILDLTSNSLVIKKKGKSQTYSLNRTN